MAVAIQAFSPSFALPAFRAQIYHRPNGSVKLKGMARCCFIASSAALIGGACRSHSPSPAPVRRAATPTQHALLVQTGRDTVSGFAFRSDFWVNLHHFLNALASAQLATSNGRLPLIAAAAADSPAIRFSTETARADWQEAIDIYAREIGRRDISADSEMVDVNYHLAALGSALPSAVKGDPNIPPEIRRALLVAEAAYVARWWPAHNASNHKWIAEMKNALAQSDGGVQRRISFALSSEPNPSMRLVEVVRYADGTGMYGSESPTLFTVSSLYALSHPGDALERMYRVGAESQTDSLRVALKDAGLDTARADVRELESLVVRYSVGDAVKRLIPAHVNSADTLAGVRRVHFAELIRKYWVPHLEGKTAMRAAAVGLAREFLQ